MNAWDGSVCCVCDKPAETIRSVSVWTQEMGYVGQAGVLFCAYHTWIHQTYRSEFIGETFWYFPERCSCGEPMEYFVYFIDGHVPRWNLYTSEPQCLLTARARAESFRGRGIPAIVTRNGSL